VSDPAPRPAARPRGWAARLAVRARARGRRAGLVRAGRGALIGLGAALVAVAASQVPLIENWERRSFDLRMRLFAAPGSADPRIVAVVIDQTSLDVIAAPRDKGGLEQSWPWPRDYYAIVLHYLLHSGARAVGFALLFTEPSIYTRLGVAEDDEELGRVAEGHAVIHAVQLSREVARSSGVIHADRDWPAALGPGRFARALATPDGTPFNKATLPVPPLLASARALGWVGFEPDEDGVFRGLRPAASYAPAGSDRAVELPSLPLALAAAAGARVELPAGRPARDGLVVDGRRIPLDEEGRMLLQFRGGEEAYRQFGFATVLDEARRYALGHATPRLPPMLFRDKVVLVGATAAGLLDLRATALSPTLPAYLLHATALDNLLRGDPARRPPARLRLALVLGLGAVSGAVVAVARTVRGGAAALAAPAGLYLGAVLAAFDARAIWLDVVAPAATMGLAYAGALAYGYLTEGRERRFLRAAFSRYLAPEVVETLVAQPRQLALGGETREITVMFADVAGFTSLGERLDPPRLVELMNECFTEITGVIQRHGGTVDKFIGDAVMAFWNAPVVQPDHAARACRAGRELLEAVARLGARWQERGLPRVSMRVGLATGRSLVGNVGSETKFNYTVMGDPVNLASRLEGAAKVYRGLSLVAGATVAAAAGAVAVRELDLLQVKGRHEAVPVFELRPEPPGAPPPPAVARYAEGLAAYRAGRFAEAARGFRAALAADPADGPAAVMLDRCLAFADNAPPEGWMGEHVLTEK
jgi:adenylate cyclase